MAHAPAHAPSGGTVHEEAHQQHPLSTYFIIWGMLFVLSLFSYLVDFFHLHGMLRWTLILIFMMAKAGLIGMACTSAWSK